MFRSYNQRMIERVGGGAAVGDNTGVIGVHRDATAGVAGGGNIAAAIITALGMLSPAEDSLILGDGPNVFLGFANADLISVSANLRVQINTQVGAAPFPTWPGLSDAVEEWVLQYLTFRAAASPARPGDALGSQRPMPLFLDGAQVGPLRFELDRGDGLSGGLLVATSFDGSVPLITAPEAVTYYAMLNVYATFQQAT